MHNGLHLPDTQQPLTVTQLSSYLKSYIEKGFFNVCIQGEISGCTRHGSGHTYFSIKDDKATVDAICWRGTAMPASMKNGTMVICHGKITTYGARSKYQMIVNKIQDAGQGAMLERIEALRKKLLAEGVFDPKKKKTLPAVPQTIALITSPTGAVIQDMLTRFKERVPCHLILCPVHVQGPRTVPDILQALSACALHIPVPDLIIIARGGGSTEDLWPFHDEQLVRAVSCHPIPIISAIGHETDTTLIDYASDQRAPTPTAAAEMALPLVRTVQERLYQQSKTLYQQCRHRYDMAFTRLDAARRVLQRERTFYQNSAQKIDELHTVLHSHFRHIIMKYEHRLELLLRAFHQTPLNKIAQHTQHLYHAYQSLKQYGASMIQKKTNHVQNMMRILEPLSYKKTMDRGFAMITDIDGTICTNRKTASQKERLNVRFSDGQLTVKPLT